MRIFSSMTGTLPDLERDFTKVELEFIGVPYKDIFGLKNNKTVAETLQHRRYRKFAEKIGKCYRDILEEPLGTSLLRLKQSGDPFYRVFLNRYGDLKYSTFRLASQEFESLTGVYAYFEGKTLRYIGRCKDSMKRRVTQGYGKICPKNCYLDGQATNCHLNAKITKVSRSITLWLCVVENSSEIQHVETSLIRKHSPIWNIQHA